MKKNPNATPPYYRRNFLALLGDYASFSFAFTFFNPDSVIPAFVAQLINSSVATGLVSAIFKSGWLLPQIGVARLINHKPRKKPYLMVGMSGRISFFILALALMLGLPRYPAMLVVACLCFAFFTVTDSLTSVAWFDVLARAIPVKARGRMMGIGQTVGGLLGVAAGVLLKQILERYTYPRNYALIFTLASVALIPSVIALILIREPPPRKTSSQTNNLGAQKQWAKRVLDNPSFRQLVLCRLLVSMITLASPFYFQHANQALGLPVSITADFVIAQTVTGVVISLLLGGIHRRWGPHNVVQIGCGAAAIGPLFALITHLTGSAVLIRAYPLIFVALGITTNTWILGFFNYAMEIAPEGMDSAYVGVLNTLLSPLTIMPLVGGWLLETTSYVTLFVVAAVFLMASFILALGLKSPRRTQTADGP